MNISHNYLPFLKKGDAPSRKNYNKQEKKNLIKDNPIADKGSAVKNLNKGYGSELGKSPLAMKGSWMSKHCKK